MSDSVDPPYSYVPGGPWPHPVRDPVGHLAKSGRPQAPPIQDEREASDSEAMTEGLRLFDRGYYWEAHEVWEGLWHAHGRVGPTADLLRALIKLAAAGVKIREGRPAGAKTHAGRASVLISSVAARVGPRWLGLDLDRLKAFADRVAERPPTTAATPSDRVAVVFDFKTSDSKAGDPGPR